MKSINRDEFIEKCLRRLGAPVISINVDDDQVDDCVDYALEYYTTYCFDYVENLFVVYELTADDITNRYITVPSNITSVKKVIVDSNNIINGGFGTNIFQGMQELAHDISFGTAAGQGGITNFVMTMNYLSEIDFNFNVHNTSEFQVKSHKLRINTDWNKLSVGSKVILDVYRAIDPNESTDIWNDLFLIEYCTSLIGIQWGTNLSKFDQVELPGGITLNGDKIYDRYLTEKTRQEEAFQSSWETPPLFLVG